MVEVTGGDAGQGVALLRGALPAWFPRDGAGYGGEGDGSSCGLGVGYGFGYDDGHGFGLGDGYNYGFGYRDGDGYGDGYGVGDKAYWSSAIDWFAARWPETQRRRLVELRAQGATIAYWRSDADGRACNGGSNEPVESGTVETVDGPLKICTEQALHATLLPPKFDGPRWWIVALIGEVQESDTKLGALKREVIGECV